MATYFSSLKIFICYSRFILELPDSSVKHMNPLIMSFPHIIFSSLELKHMKENILLIARGNYDTIIHTVYLIR
jgi:hypothetical protein